MFKIRSLKNSHCLLLRERLKQSTEHLVFDRLSTRFFRDDSILIRFKIIPRRTITPQICVECLKRDLPQALLLTEP